MVERELELFESDSYMIRKQVFYWFYAAEFYIYSDESMENLIGFSSGWVQDALLRERVTIYSDESRSTKLLKIKQENILDSMAVYSIADRQTGGGTWFHETHDIGISSQGIMDSCGFIG